MKNALLAPVNTDGQRAMMVEYDINYPFQYWNTGASWMILPIAEWVDCYGDVSITTTDQKIIKQYNKEVFNVKKDILMPLLQKLIISGNSSARLNTIRILRAMQDMKRVRHICLLVRSIL